MKKNSKKLVSGFIQVYTGNGKGKTTAALGLSVRAAGAGLKIYIGQFLKAKNYSEINALKQFSKHITIEQFGTSRFVGKKINAKDKQRAQAGWETVSEIIRENRYDLVVLDEINVAIAYGMINEQEVIRVLRVKPREMEIVLTGRDAPKSIINHADLVTEMKEIKHYFQKKINARTGIEK